MRISSFAYAIMAAISLVGACGAPVSSEDPGSAASSLAARMKATLTVTSTLTRTATSTATVTNTSTGTATLTNTSTATGSGVRTYTATRSNSGTVSSLWTFTGSGTHTMQLHQGDTGTKVTIGGQAWGPGTATLTGSRANATMTGTDSAGNTATYAGVESGTATATFGRTINSVVYTWTSTSANTADRTVIGTGTWTSTEMRTLQDTWTGSATFTRSATGTVTNTGTGTGTGTVTQTSTGTGTTTGTTTSTGTTTTTGTSTTTTTSTGTATSPAACLQGWEQSGNCGDWCEDWQNVPGQDDKKGCKDVLKCYIDNNCSPSTCGANPDDVCGSHKFSFGDAAAPIANQVYTCLGCPGSTPAPTCGDYPNTTPCNNNGCRQNGTCQNGTCQGGTVLPDYSTCDDHKGDTVEDTCQKGQCVGAPTANASVPADSKDTVQSPLSGSFSVSPDGAASYTIPLDVPEGRAGMSPKLALRYSSAGGDGIVGVGWSLAGATSQIARCPRNQPVHGRALPVLYSAWKNSSGHFIYADAFCLDGDYLVPPETPTITLPGVVEFRPEHNPSVRVTMHEGDLTGPEYFLVEYPDGRKANYGAMPVSQAGVPNNNPTSFAPIDTGTSGPVRPIWLLSTVYDPAGNGVTYTYTGRSSALWPDYIGLEWVPDTIAYTTFGGSVVPRKVVFGYTTRSDTSTAWVSGLNFGSTKLLKTITVYGPNPVTSGVLWTYTLTYKNNSVSGRSLLDTVTQCAADGTCKPTMTFGWELGASTFTKRPAFYTGDPAHTLVRVLDINGDGLPDFIAAFPDGNSGYNLSYALGGTYGGFPNWMPLGIDYSKLDTSGNPKVLSQITPIDIDSDGVPELAVRGHDSSGNVLRFYQFNGTTYTLMSDNNGDEQPGTLGESIYVGDLDGDGFPELIRDFGDPDSKWHYRKNTNGKLGPYDFLRDPNSNPGTVPAVNTFNAYIAQLDGSGRSKILLEGDSSQVIKRYDQIALVSVPGSPPAMDYSVSTVPWVLRAGNDGMGKVMMDLNGDGLADALEYPPNAHNSSTSTYFINTGTGMLGGYKNFIPPMVLQNIIYADADKDAFLAMDVNQDGREDIVSAPWRGVSTIRLFLSNGKGLDASTTLSHSQQDGGGPIEWGGWSGKAGMSLRFMALDANGDGLMDFMMGDHDTGNVNIYEHDGKKADMMTSVSLNGGGSIDITYSPYTAQTPKSERSECKYPVRCPAIGPWVVDSYRVRLPGNTLDTGKDYTYDEAAVDMLGRGWLGYGKRVVSDAITDERTTYLVHNTTRLGTSYPYVGLPYQVVNKVVLYKGGASPSSMITSTTQNWYELTLGNVVDLGHSFAFGLSHSTFDQKESGATWNHQKQDWDEVPPTTPMRHIDTYVDYDIQGNVSSTMRYLTDGSMDGASITHLNDTTNWMLSPPTVVTSQSKSGPAGDPALVERTTNYDYKPTMPRSLKKITVLGDGSASQHLEVNITGWNVYGLPTAATAVDQNGTSRNSSIEYDALEHSQPSIVTNAAGHVSHTVYHKGLNLPIWTMDPNGLTTTYSYYPFGRLQSVTPPDGNTLTMSYGSPPSNVGGMLQITRSRASGEQSSQVLDLLGRAIASSRLAMKGKTSRTLVTYDERFLNKPSYVSVTKFTDDTSAEQDTTFLYDEVGRTTSVTTSDGRVLQLAYAALTTTTTDPRGNVSYAIQDELGRVVKNVAKMPGSDAGGAREIPTEYIWGAYSQLSQIIDANGNATKTVYDRLGRPSSRTDPDRGDKTFGFDAFGNLVSVIDPKGTTTITPDLLGRTTKLVSPDGTTTYTWDTAANGVGLLASATSPDGVVMTPVYDSLSRLSTETWKIENEAFTAGLGYDKFGRPSTVSYPDVTGWTTFKATYNYATNGDLESLTDVPSGSGTSTLFWKADSRDPVGRITAEEFGNHTKTSYDIDQVRGVVNGITTTLGTTTLQSLSYGYDNNLNVTSRTDNVAVPNLFEVFYYDALDRLTTWEEDHNYGWSVTYSHDDIGNLTGRSLFDIGNLTGRSPRNTAGGNETLTFEHSYNVPNAGPHALTHSPWGDYTYDGKGNPTTTPEGTISYTSFDLPKSIATTGNTTTFKYDATGTRVWKSSTTGGTTVYVGGLYERRTVGSEKQHVFNLVAGGRQIGQVIRKESDHSETIQYIHADSLGSSEAATNSSGAIVGERRKYDPFGNRVDIKMPKLNPGPVLMSSDVHIGFTGQEEDSETGLINMRGRIYNARVGHFLTPDPFTQDPTHPAGLNPYAYVMNNPLKYTDPSGFGEEDGSGDGGEDPFENYPFPPDNGRFDVLVKESRNSHGGGGLSPTDYGKYPKADVGFISDPYRWWPGGGTPYPIEFMNDLSGRLILRLPGGGWVTSDNPKRVNFQARDGSRGGMSLDRWLDDYTVDPDLPIFAPVNQKALNNLGEISDNPSPAPTVNVANPSHVGGQSAPTTHPSNSAPGGGAIYAMVPGPRGNTATDSPPVMGTAWTATAAPGAGLVVAGVVGVYIAVQTAVKGIIGIITWLSKPPRADKEPTVKDAEREFRMNPDFRRWTHREYKKDQGGGNGPKTNPDLPSDVLLDALKQWRFEGSPKVK